MELNEILKIALFKCFAGLLRVWGDPFDRDQLFSARRRAGCLGFGHIRHQGGQPTAQPTLAIFSVSHYPTPQLLFSISSFASA